MEDVEHESWSVSSSQLKAGLRGPNATGTSYSQLRSILGGETGEDSTTRSTLIFSESSVGSNAFRTTKSALYSCSGL